MKTVAAFLYFIPIFFNTHTIGHQLVKADCKRLTPTKIVNHSQRKSTKCASNTLIIINTPAIPRNTLSIVPPFHTNKHQPLPTACLTAVRTNNCLVRPGVLKTTPYPHESIFILFHHPKISSLIFPPGNINPHGQLPLIADIISA